MTQPKPGCAGKLRVCIGMLNSPGIPNYAISSTWINYLYSVRHKYDFIVNRCPDDTDVDWKWDPKHEYTLVWYKAEFIKKYLPSYHVFVYIDSDAVFRDAAKSVEQFLAEENDNALIYASADCMSEQICWKKNELNAGFLVVKNTPKTFELLDAWIKAPETALCREWKYTHPREQACLNELQKSQYANEIKILPRDKRVGTHDGNWVVHLAGVKDSTREHYFTQMINGNDPVLVTNTVGSLTFLASHKAAIVTGMLVAVILVVWLVVWRVAKR